MRGPAPRTAGRHQVGERRPECELLVRRRQPRRQPPWQPRARRRPTTQRRRVLPPPMPLRSEPQKRGRSVAEARSRPDPPARPPDRGGRRLPATTGTRLLVPRRRQLRGLGQPRLASAATFGTCRTRAGRTCRKAATAARAATWWVSEGPPERKRVGAGKPTASPLATALASTGQSRWTRRLASGGARSQPSAASSGGLAAATTRTPGGSARSPTTRSSTTRNMAAWTAGGEVVSSSRNRRPTPLSASLVAQAGGAIRTPPLTTTGIPAKSAGSLMEPITTSSGQSSSSARARTADVLPVPGLPQRITGTPAAIARASASVTLVVSMTDLLA